MHEELVQLISETIGNIVEQLDVAPPAELGAETPLFGRAGFLDSLGLVSLIVAVEQAIEDRFGAAISLADERAMSQRSSPYKTIGSLAAYSASALEEAALVKA